MVCLSYVNCYYHCISNTLVRLIQIGGRTVRYKIETWVWNRDSFQGKFIKNEVSNYLVVDLHMNNQIVAEFPVKVAKDPSMNAEYCGVLINDARLALDMAKMVCNQMNRLSGY